MADFLDRLHQVDGPNPNHIPAHVLKTWLHVYAAEGGTQATRRANFAARFDVQPDEQTQALLLTNKADEKAGISEAALALWLNKVETAFISLEGNYPASADDHPLLNANGTVNKSVLATFLEI